MTKDVSKFLSDISELLSIEKLPALKELFSDKPSPRLPTIAYHTKHIDLLNQILPATVFSRFFGWGDRTLASKLLSAKKQGKNTINHLGYKFEICEGRGLVKLIALPARFLKYPVRKES